MAQVQSSAILPPHCRTVYIQPTTGGQMEMKVTKDWTVVSLKRAIANRLKVPKDRIVLLLKNKQLVEGTLEDNHITDGARLTLLPSVETGIAPQRPERYVMQALEALNESQVENFLAGRFPLNLSMRLGDHMMFIQLQLSTVGPSSTTSKSVQTTAATNPPSLIPTPPTTPTSVDSPVNFPSTSTHQNVISAPLSPPPSPKKSIPPSTDNSDTSDSPSNSRAFAEASRNLVNTLKKLSSTAFSKKMNESCDGSCCVKQKEGGAVIESMYHHGRGVYSGTFSGTLSPSLQDKDGKPRRDISTVVQILNDLLGASSHCRPSAQCLIPSNSTEASSSSSSSKRPSTNHTTISSLEVKVGNEQKKQEDKVLKQKVEKIQTMLEERRIKRRARRDVRSSPYPKERTKEVDLRVNIAKPSLGSEHGDQKMTDYSSETAVV